jgi:hypothetical protein
MIRIISKVSGREVDRVINEDSFSIDENDLRFIDHETGERVCYSRIAFYAEKPLRGVPA